MNNKYCDPDNQHYCNIYDFFNTVFAAFKRDGMDEHEARACAYDAVELRFGIGRDRARAIIIGIRRSGRNNRTMRPIFMSDNARLIELLQLINSEYASAK